MPGYTLLLRPLNNLTYAEFLLLFILIPLIVLSAATSLQDDKWPGVRLQGVAVISLIALLYTTPWDNHLIAHGVWQYENGTVIAFVGRPPIEEYCFILLQPIIVALWLGLIRYKHRSIALCMPRSKRLVGVFAGVGIGIAGALAMVGTSTYYLGAILVWAAPVLALQWAFGWPYLWIHWRTLLVGVIIPTVYLSIADLIAISMGIWTLSERYTIGITMGKLPIEEVVFFLITNLFVIQGMLLFDWVIDR